MTTQDKLDRQSMIEKAAIKGELPDHDCPGEGCEICEAYQEELDYLEPDDFSGVGTNSPNDER